MASWLPGGVSVLQPSACWDLASFAVPPLPKASAALVERDTHLLILFPHTPGLCEAGSSVCPSRASTVKTTAASPAQIPDSLVTVEADARQFLGIFKLSGQCLQLFLTLLKFQTLPGGCD